MSKLIYRYATMGSGKTREIVSVKYNYEQIGDNCLVFVPDIVDKVESRSGDSVNSISFNKSYEDCLEFYLDGIPKESIVLII